MINGGLLPREPETCEPTHRKTDGWATRQVKYVLVIDHNNPADPCGQNYCGLRDGESVPVSLPELFSGETVLLRSQSLYTLIRRLKDMVGPSRRNSGDLIVILDAEGLSNGLDPNQKWQFKDTPPSWLPEYFWTEWIIKLARQGAKTVHGSISSYESNTIFCMFYPFGNGDPEIKRRFWGFLDTYTPKESYGTTTIDRLSTNHADVFVNAPSNSHLLLMEAKGQ